MYPTSELDKRYEEDPEFHALVQYMESFLVKAEFSLADLRTAATYAAIRWEMRRPRRYIYDRRTGSLEIEEIG